MRVTDLARKLDLKTTELREKLPDFGIAKDTKDIDTKLVETIREKLLNDGTDDKTDKNSNDGNDDEGPALMGMMFESADDIKKKEQEEESDRDSSSENEKEEADNDDKESGLHLGVRKTKSSAEQKAARERWAAAKAASEKIINEKSTEPKKSEKNNNDNIEPTRKSKKMAELVIDKTKPKRKIAIGDTVSVREFGEKIGISPIRIVAELLKSGVVSNVNGVIDYDTASIVAENFWCEIIRDTTAVSGEDLLKGNIAKLLEDDPKNLTERPPVVAVMGHVDHGKTTLLDTIRKTDVVASESGGITQHIGAYQTTCNNRKITFLDTPGHEAFTAMRARGARATDIAVLVIAADDGVKPQTIEAINHAKDAGVPIVVAITKIDREGANIDKVKTELAEYDLQPSDWGGKIEMVPVSAPTDQGIEELLEIILLTNDIEPVQGNPNREAVGTVIESHLDKSLGPVATVIVNTGTLKNGDNFIIGQVTGRVKKMFDHNRKTIKEALPGTPILIAGLSKLPERGVGEILQAFPDATTTRKKSEEFARLIELRNRKKVTNMGQLIGRINTGIIKELKIVLKADVEGSLEAIQTLLGKIENPEVKPKIIHAGVGNITETDVLMAAASEGLLIAFHVKASPQVEKVADRENVVIRRHTIIYKLSEEIEQMLRGMLDPEEIETELGTLEVRGVFFTKPKEQVIGGLVKDGKLENGANVRIMRGEEEIGTGKITSLKKGQDDVKDVKENHECGLKVEVKGIKIEEGDTLIAWKIEKKEKNF